MLNRLDARCDRAERIGAPTQRLAAVWEAYLAALAEDRTADAEALLAPPPSASVAAALLGQGSESILIHQLHQRRAGKALDEEDAAEEAEDAQRMWVTHGTWRTNYPPPDGFYGNEDGEEGEDVDENGEYGDEGYHRSCTPDERELLDRRYPTLIEDEQEDSIEADEAERDAFFAALAEEEEEDPAAATPAEGDHPDALLSSFEGFVEACPEQSRGGSVITPPDTSSPDTY